MVARYAPPISYNFLNLIRLGGNAKTTFEKVIVVFFFAALHCLWYIYINSVHERALLLVTWKGMVFGFSLTFMYYVLCLPNRKFIPNR